MRKFLIATALAALSIGVLTPLSSAQQDEQVCPGVHEDGGNQTSIEVTAPDGFLISEYCVKAGEGFEIVAVDPPQKTVTIEHSSGKEISHYSLTLVPEVPETPPTPAGGGGTPAGGGGTPSGGGGTPPSGGGPAPSPRPGGEPGPAPAVPSQPRTAG